MQEFLGVSGNTHYLINIDFDEAMGFDSFGNANGIVTGKYAVLSSKIRTEVDIISAIGNSINPICDVYFCGESCIVSKSAFNLVRELSKKVQRVNHLIYRVKHDYLGVGTTQVLLPIVKGSLSKKDFMTLCNIKEMRRVG